MRNSELITRCVQEIDEAVKSFGTYSYNDKSPNEVMFVEPLVKEIRVLNPKDAASVLRSVALSIGLSVNPAALSEAIVLDLQDWDELFEQPGVEELLNCEEPVLVDGDAPVAFTKKSKKAKP